MNSSPQQVVLLYLCFAATTASISTGKPNILFLQCDEMDGRVLDPNHPLSAVTSMPHLQKLAARGVNFVRAYAENPLCAPSRAGLFTGRRTSSIRVWNNVKALTALIDDPTQPDPTCANVVGYGADWCVEEGKKQNVTSSIRHELVQLGYDVHLVGKMDTGGGVCREGVDHCFGGNGYHDTGNWSTNTSNVRTYYKGDLIHSWASSASIGEPVFQPLESPRNAWISTDNPDGGPFPQDWPMINRCVDFLRNLGGPTTSRSGEEAGAKPFALYCSVLDPHPPYFTNATWISQINNTALDATIAATRWQPVELLHPADRFQFMAEGVPATYDENLAKRLALAWHGQTAETDAMMGAVLDALAASPAADNTFIIFTSDHGEMHLEHRHVEKMTHYEGSARVPMIIAGPQIPHGVTETTLVSLLDVFATLVDVGGAPVPEFADGFSLLPLAGAPSTDAHRSRPPWVAAMAACDSLNAAQFMLREGDWKAIYYAVAGDDARFPPQLFNVSSDPWEMHDVAAAHPNVVASMDITLRGAIDYPRVMLEYEAQGREWGQRWTAAIGTGQDGTPGWRALLHSAFANFTAGDEAKFEGWLAGK